MNIGAAWKKESNGKKYLSCKMNALPLNWDGNFAMFVNERKESDNHPDYHIVASEKGERKKDDMPF